MPQLLTSLIIATIPGGLAGLLFKDKIETIFRSPQTVAISLFIFSGLLLIGDYLTKKRNKNSTVSLYHALIIGIFQAIAIIPGVSRSGSTITGGLITGYNRKTAVQFAFLLSIPIILLAGAKQAFDLLTSTATFTTDQFAFFFIGFTTAFVVALVVVKWFLRFFQNQGFLPFIIYRIVLSLSIIFFLH